MSDVVGRVGRAAGARPADLRIALPTVSAWAASAVLIGSPEAAVTAAVGAGVVAAVGIVVLFLRGVGDDAAADAGWLGAALSIVVTGALLVGLVAVAVAVGQERRAPAAFSDTEGPRAVRVTLDRDLEPGARSVTGTLTAVGEVTALRVPVRVVPDGLADHGPHRLAAGSTVRGSAAIEADDPGSPTAAVVFLRGPVRVDQPTGLLAVTDRSRQAFVAVTAELPGPGAALLRGMAIGDRSGLDPATVAAMETTALTHLTAVSGANCAVIVGLVVLFGRAVGLPRLVRASVAVGFLLAFVVLVRPDPSIVRATVMAVVVLVVHLSGRPVRGVPLIALAVTGMLVADPWYARSFAFALSVLATAGIVVLAPPLTGLLARRVWPPVAAVVAVPVAAQVACWPVTILLAPLLPTYGVPANLLAEPLAPIVTVVGLGACLVAPMWPTGAAVLAAVAWLPASIVGWIARTASALPGASAPWPTGSTGVVLAVMVCAGIAVAVFVGTTGRVRLLLASAVVLVIGVGSVGVPRVVVRGSVPVDWTTAACDVGQGDAVLLRSGGSVALVDTGDDPELLRACLDLLRVDRLALLVLTHFDRDHVGAVAEVEGAVTTALVGPVGRPADDRVVQELRRAGAEVLRAAAGTSVGLGSARIDVTWPPATSSDSGNDASLVLRVRASERDDPVPSALLLGDLGETAQRRMRASDGRNAGPLGPVDVVKVSHHGSADQDAGLYRALGARVALIGVGADNSYGHPTRRTLDMLAATGAAVFRTDVHGTAVVAPGPDGPRVWTEHPVDSSAGRASPVSFTAGAASSVACSASAASPVGRRIVSATGAPPFAPPEGPHARQEARARRREDRPGLVVGRPAGAGRPRHRPRGVPGRPGDQCAARPARW
ncbi:ComEC/Rec2 family competence protein [Curtobacterium sp. 458]|uniref:ComEC/Rec2 family competence protein n=1 Tax=Curtobacterium sp. 458 TaxID=3050069 RepID=UPI0025B43B1F|nr:ComEC/Rec2 family competence protein [Curtobacterium sp. 458]WJX99710.1 ComEC/Rec2 family competence protein [Curtobacterium sp. 458]